MEVAPFFKQSGTTRVRWGQLYDCNMIAGKDTIKINGDDMTVTNRMAIVGTDVFAGRVFHDAAAKQ